MVQHLVKSDVSMDLKRHTEKYQKLKEAVIWNMNHVVDYDIKGCF